MSKKTESQILFPDGKEIEIGGEKIIIEVMKIHQIVKGTDLLSTFVDAIYLFFRDKILDKSKIMKIIGSHGQDVLKFMAIASSKDEDFINNLLPDEAVELLISIIEVNSDFLISRVLPMLNKATESRELFTKKT